MRKGGPFYNWGRVNKACIPGRPRSPRKFVQSLLQHVRETLGCHDGRYCIFTRSIVSFVIEIHRCLA